MTWRT